MSPMSGLYAAAAGTGFAAACIEVLFADIPSLVSTDCCRVVPASLASRSCRGDRSNQPRPMSIKCPQPGADDRVFDGTQNAVSRPPPRFPDPPATLHHAGLSGTDHRFPPPLESGTLVAVLSGVRKADLAAATVFLFAGACGGVADHPPVPCANLDCRPTRTITWTASSGRRPIDLILVVDDRVLDGPARAAFTEAMNEVATNMQEVVDMRRYAADIHVALVPANLDLAKSPPSLWPASQACPLPTGPYVQLSELCDVPVSFSGPLADLFACATTHLPASGLPGRPFEVLRAVLSPNGPAWATGFRRPTAHLLLAIVTSEDDLTVAESSGRKDMVDFLNGLISDELSLWTAVAAPAGATGIIELLAALDQSEPDDIVAPSWISFRGLGRDYRSKTVEVCVDMLGQPPACEVVERIAQAGGTVERPLPECPTAETPVEPCWRTWTARAMCPGSELSFEYVEPALTCRTGERTTVEAKCATPYQPAQPLGEEEYP